MMFDSCICVDHDSHASFSTNEWRTARKQYVCCECGDPILPGAKYEHVFGVWDGDVSVYKTCYLCVRIRKSLFSCGWIYGQMWQDIQDSYGDDCETDEEEEENERLGRDANWWLEP
jgi:hypothetical protein